MVAGQGGAMEVGKVVGTAYLVYLHLLIETVSGRMVLGGSAKFVKRSSMVKTEPWPLDMGSGMWDVEGDPGGRRKWEVRKQRQGMWTPESQARSQSGCGVKRLVSSLPPLLSLPFETWKMLGYD